MSNFFNERDIKLLKTFGNYLMSFGMRGRAEMEIYQGDDFGGFSYTDDEDIPSNFSNNWRVEVPEFIHPIINKVMNEAQKIYDEVDFDHDLNYHRVELEIDPKEKQISVDIYGTYYGRESAGGAFWELEDEEPDSKLHKIFETLFEISSGREILLLRYNGGGDSGYLEGSFDSGESVPADIDDWCYQQLENMYGGWEINEGSDGVFEFNLKDKTVNLEHTYNTEENVSENLFREKY